MLPKFLIKNYRPISLLPICGKFLEKLIFNKLYSYLQLNDLRGNPPKETIFLKNHQNNSNLEIIQVNNTFIWKIIKF